MSDLSPRPQDVVLDAANHRFELLVDGHVAVLEYRLEEGGMVITHTGVPEAIGGRGIAGTLTRAALDHARAQGWKVIPACTYAAAFMRRHGEYADLRG
ncbi:acetyltransferase [Stenotrophomonas pictorum JCM 9942]|jgi:predicted GNAT family acetyltransferase|uniref:Acetyltransferase n=1 Tax=Stenotrophomonas pictorum JCM 9942 TaxID=1236960 RepID=A0A0R0AD23_9GAMM|nr:GNAT family N-acetyltransferase [Stenotrophomonas pictorum]KRG42800.1 acetyltransferase [Stenotrophomonas pictorum JCM 9942]